MGGGVGLSVHGKFRVATENTLFAKPETGIGLFPDVGGTHVLPRVAGGLPVGLYVGLTGARLRAADCLQAGLATHFCPSDRLGALREGLVALGDKASDADAVDGVIRTACGGAEPDASKAVLVPDSASAGVIQACFAEPTAEGIFAALAEHGGAGGAGDAFAQETLETLQRMSPTSIKVTIEAARRHAGDGVTISEALNTEYRLSQRFMRAQPASDFREGIRAVLVDKDNKPAWNPPTLDQVADADVASFFAPLEAGHPRGELQVA